MENTTAAQDKMIGRLEDVGSGIDDLIDLVKDFDGQLSEANSTISKLEEALREIGDFAHSNSTGPSVPDALWEVRTMAYDAFTS